MTPLDSRRALEALRNGVPNRSAVRALGCNQPRAEHRFVELLDKAANAGAAPSSSPGMLVSGDFGTGKSHFLTHLEHLALSRNFVCSKVTISKETPFYDLGKVFSSAIENGRTPRGGGRLVEELALALDPKSEKYEDFYRWTEDAAASGLLHPIFPASLLVHEKSTDLELTEEIVSFWAGERIQIARIRAGLRQIGEARRFRFRAPRVADLPPQRLRFTIELVKSVGHRGWMILLDEIELIGSYSILQRGRSYAEMARWMGRVEGEAYPGMMIVGAVTDDFASAVISPDGQKKDRDYIRPKLEDSARYAALGPRAEAGMRVLERESLPLETPGEDDVNSTIGKLHGLYRDVYGWEPPPHTAAAGGAGERGRMRHKIRTAINEWDLRRLNRLRPGDEPDTVIETFKPDYNESPDLEPETADDPG